MPKPKSPKTDTRNTDSPQRAGVGLARALSKYGLASRTTAANWIEAGHVSVNGKVVRNPEHRVAIPSDRLAFDGVPVSATQKRYIVLNKPRGLVTTRHDEQGRRTVYECLTDVRDQWLAPVGRLDKASEGLLLFTNDTQWAQRILNPDTHMTKVYHVQLAGLVDEATLTQLGQEMLLKEGMRTRAARVTRLRGGAKNCWLEISLDEGRNRQIRRMAESVGLRVLRLVRIAIGPVQLNNLAKGQARDLSAEEVAALAGE